MTTIYFKGPNHCLSNLYPCRIHVFGKWYESAEHAYQWMKCRHAGNLNLAEKILRTKNPFQAKAIGAQCFIDEPWDLNKERFMFQILLAKARYCPEYESYLLDCPQDVIFRENTRHKFWGGIPNVGQNKLGFLHYNVKAHCHSVQLNVNLTCSSLNILPVYL